jgi:hypothetical protein
LPGFVIVDVGDSANPFVVGDTSLPVYAQAVWVNNNFGYGFVANSYEGLKIININDPTDPWVEAEFDGADDSRDVFVQGNYAYVANWRKGLKIIDVGTPSNPFEVGEYDTSGIYPNLQTIWSRDTLAYIPVEWPFVFKVLNVSNPSSPSLLEYCNMKTAGSDIFVKDTFAYVVGSNIFQTFNVSNPASPDSLPSYMLPYTVTWSVFVQDTFAYIANADSGLRILNISNPAAPFEVGYYDNPPGGGATGISVKDTLAYFATWGGGLRILNVTDPSSPSEIGFHPSAALDVIVKDTVAYVSSNLGYVNFIDISDPVNPVLIGYYENPHYSYRLFVDSNLVYITCYEAGMSILEWDDTGMEESYKGKIVTNGIRFSLMPTLTRKSINLSIYSLYKQNIEVVIYDECGRKVMSVLTRKTLKGGLKKRINLSDISNGVYFVVLKTEKKDLAQKIVIIH